MYSDDRHKKQPGFQPLHDSSETVLPLSNTVLRQSIIKSRVRLTLKGHGDYVWSAVYSPDGQHIVTASWDKIAKVWDANTGTELMTLAGHEDGVGRASYSPEHIVTASGDKTAKVWDAVTGKELVTLTGHEGGVFSAVYSPDGQRIATAGSGGIVQIYTTDMNELLQIAESRVTRQLTAEEKEKYGVLDLN